MHSVLNNHSEYIYFYIPKSLSSSLPVSEIVKSFQCILEKLIPGHLAFNTSIRYILPSQLESYKVYQIFSFKGLNHNCQGLNILGGP